MIKNATCLEMLRKHLTPFTRYSNRKSLIQFAWQVYIKGNEKSVWFSNGLAFCAFIDSEKAFDSVKIVTLRNFTSVIQVHFV